MQAKVDINGRTENAELKFRKEGPLGSLYVNGDKVEDMEPHKKDDEVVVLHTQDGKVVRVPSDTFYAIEGMPAVWHPKFGEAIANFTQL